MVEVAVLLGQELIQVEQAEVVVGLEPLALRLVLEPMC